MLTGNKQAGKFVPGPTLAASDAIKHWNTILFLPVIFNLYASLNFHTNNSLKNSYWKLFLINLLKPDRIWINQKH